MSNWPNRRILDQLHIEVPIIQAPMAGSNGSAMAAAVSLAGGLGSLPCALISPVEARSEVAAIRQRTRNPINLNFFCHTTPAADAARERAWKQQLLSYYLEFGLDPQTPAAGASRAPFDSALCGLVEELKPEVVSFHFGLPNPDLVARVRATGAVILSSATTVREAVWLESNGCDAVIAQGAEAGGHRGMFLADSVATQVGTMALVPQVVDAVKVPVIAAGGIVDARGIAAAFALGAAAVQMGTAFLFCPEAKLSLVYRQALKQARDDQTVMTNVFTGRPARGLLNRAIRELGPLSPLAPAFPNAASALMPLRLKSEALGSGDFSPLWAGQAAALGRELPAGELVKLLAEEFFA